MKNSTLNNVTWHHATVTREMREKRLAQVESIRKMRERLAKKGVLSDSLLTLKKTRKERVEEKR